MYLRLIKFGWIVSSIMNKIYRALSVVIIVINKENCRLFFLNRKLNLKFHDV